MIATVKFIACDKDWQKSRNDERNVVTKAQKVSPFVTQELLGEVNFLQGKEWREEWTLLNAIIWTKELRLYVTASKRKFNTDGDKNEQAFMNEAENVEAYNDTRNIDAIHQENSMKSHC